MNVDHQSIPATARKRKRNLPSTSSDVEPATFQTHTGLETDGCVHRSIYSASANNAELKETVRDSNNSCSDLSTHRRGRTEKSYGRKPRRKTREDRYDLKQDKVVRKPRTRKKRHHPREREEKRRKKSSSGMMHDFSSENVVPKRLTVSPYDEGPCCLQELSALSTDLRNSSNQHSRPDYLTRVERHRQLREKDVSILYLPRRKISAKKKDPVPDLSFSELSFLKSKREKPNDSIEDKIEEPRLKKEGPDALISRYFVSRKLGDQSSCPSCGFTFSNPFGRATPEHEYPSRGQLGCNVTPSEVVHISEEQCLGFGSSRMDLTSPARHIERRTNSQSPRSVSTRTSSLVSWSVSGVPSHHDSIDRGIKNPSVPNASTNMKTDHQASVTGHSQQKPYDSVPLRRKVIHSNDTCKVSKFDEQQDEPPGFMAGNALSKTMMTDRARVLGPQANRREKGMFEKELVFSGQEDSQNQELQTPCDAAPENCPRHCISTTPLPHRSVRARDTNTMCLPDKLDNVHYGNPTLLSQVNHGIQASTTDCVYENSKALHNNFVEPHIIHRARSFELWTDPPEGQLKLGLIDHDPRINQCNNLDACRADRPEGPDRLSTGLSNHEFCTSDVSNNHEKPPQRRLQIRNLSNGGFDEHCHHQLGNGCSNHTNMLAALENLDGFLVACNPGNFPNHEQGAIDDHRNDSFYGRNDSTETFEGLSNSYDEQKTGSASHEIEELPPHYLTNNETMLDPDVRDDEPPLQENIDAGYYSVLENSHEDLLDPELEPSGWHQNMNESIQRRLRGKRYSESFLPWYDTGSGAGNIVDTRQVAAELVIQGFWKPQKPY